MFQGDIRRLYILTGEDAIYTTPGTRPSGRPVTIILAESAVRVCVPVGYVLKRKHLILAVQILAGY